VHSNYICLHIKNGVLIVQHFNFDSVISDRHQNVDKMTENVDKMTENVDKMTENVDKMTQNVDKITENVDVILPFLIALRYLGANRHLLGQVM
jgi:prefoldin subunit 5